MKFYRRFSLLIHFPPILVDAGAWCNRTHDMLMLILVFACDFTLSNIKAAWIGKVILILAENEENDADATNISAYRKVAF